MYEPKSYWEDLLSRQPDLTGVAHPEMPLALNRALYDHMRREVVKALARNNVSVAGADVIDIGSGTGFWMATWVDLGARAVTGVELTTTATERLRSNFSNCTVVQADIGEPELPVDGSYDLVSAMSVLLHLVEPARFEQALDNLTRLVKPEGWLLVTDPAPRHHWWGNAWQESDNSVARPLRQWVHDLEGRQFRLADVRPVSCVLNNVSDTKYRWGFRLHQQYWYHLGKGLSRFPRLSPLAVSSLAVMDTAMLRLGWSPSTKVLVLQRKAED